MQGEPDMEVAVQDVTALNEELMDKLRLLNYQKDFVSRGNKPISIASFSVATNPSEQFNVFKNLVKWLFQMNDIQSSEFSKYDDPMTVSTNIINESKKLQIALDFPPLKLKGGSGQQVVSLLNQLASKALKRKNFNFKTPKFQAPKTVEEQGDDEPRGQDGDEQMIQQADIAEQDDLDDKEQIGAAALDQQKQIIHSAVNQNDWKLECERVANKLKIQNKQQDSKQWRAHIESTRTCGDHIKKNFPQTRVVLEKLNDELTKTLEKISKSERMINTNMRDVGDQYKSQSEELKKLSAHYNNLNNSIKEMNQTQRLVGQKLEQMQVKINQHSGSMTDSSPVVKIKESLKNILGEIKSMDVRMGVLNHTILQYKTKERHQNLKVNKMLNMDADEFDEF